MGVSAPVTRLGISANGFEGPTVTQQAFCRSIGLTVVLTTEKHVNEITNELEQGVFWVLYRSRVQRTRRAVAAVVLLIKYLVLGMYFLWPAYIVVVALLLIPLAQEYLFLLFALLPALLPWMVIYGRSAKNDYKNLVQGRILGKGFIRRLVGQ